LAVWFSQNLFYKGMKFKVEYEIPPMRAILTVDVEAVDADAAWGKVKAAHPGAHVRKIVLVDEG